MCIHIYIHTHTHTHTNIQVMEPQLLKKKLIENTLILLTLNLQKYRSKPDSELIILDVNLCVTSRY